MGGDNIRPQGRCCDCRFLGTMPGGEVTCEGPIPDVYQKFIPVNEWLTAQGATRYRRCDCFTPKPLEDK